MELRDSLADRTQRGIGATLAGMLFWLGVGVMAATSAWPLRTRAWLVLAGSLLVYPVGYVLNRALRGDLLARGHRLGGLVRTLGFTECLGWAVVVVFVLQAPELVPFSVAAMSGAHFLPLAWLYRSGAYALLGIVAMMGAALVQLFAPHHAWTWIPFGLAIAYAMTSVAIARRNRRSVTRPRTTSIP